MPPVMGVAAFLMAEFLGKSYFEVVARGYVPALIYYATVAVVGLSAGAALSHAPVARPSTETLMHGRTVVNLAAFLAVIGGLIGMMAAWHLRADVRRALRVRRGRRRLCSSSISVPLLRARPAGRFRPSSRRSARSSMPTPR